MTDPDSISSDADSSSHTAGSPTLITGSAANADPAVDPDPDRALGDKAQRNWKHALIQVGLLAVGLYFFARSFRGVDLAELGATLRQGSVPLMLMALLVAQLPRFTWAVSTRAACPKPIPYGPVVLLQFALPFFNLVAPYTVARMAINIRFFRRLNVPAASAVTLSAIDTSAGTVVDVFLLIALLVFGLGDVNLDFDRSKAAFSGDLLDVLVSIFGLALAAGLIWLAVPRLRKQLVNRVRPWLVEIRTTISALRSPRRIALLLLGNLGSELLLAATLWIVVQGFGASVSYATALAVNVGVSLFASLLPIPGGIGISEAALTFGLVGAGLDQSTALVCAIAYRMCTYYLPPIWAWFAYRRLNRLHYL